MKTTAFKALDTWYTRARRPRPNPSHIKDANPTNPQNLIELLGLD